MKNLIKLSITGKNKIIKCPQQKWIGDNPRVLQTAIFAGQEMMLIQLSDEKPDLYELTYLGFELSNIKGIDSAKEQAPLFAKEVLKKLSLLIN